MINAKRYINKFVKDHNAKIEANKDKLIEAFVKFYGQEYESLIKKRFDELVFCWFISDKHVQIYDKVAPIINHNIAMHSINIFRILGIKEFLFDSNETAISDAMEYYMKILNDNENISSLATYLFGEHKIFDFNYDEDLLYNFDSLDEETKKELLQKIFKKTQISENEQQRLSRVKDYLTKIKYQEARYHQIKDLEMVISYLEDEEKKNITLLDRAFLSRNKLKNKENCGFGIIGSNKRKIFAERNEDVLDALNKTVFKNYYAFHTNATPKLKIVALPILITNDSVLIHELDHGICSEILLEIKYKDGIEYIGKSGIDTSEQITKLEEIITEKSTQEITDIFHSLGGKVFENIYDRYYKCQYRVGFPLIEEFYKKYKALIKKVRITTDKNLLYRFFHKDKYEEYKTFVNSSYHKAVNIEDRKISQEEQERANLLVSQMKKPLKDTMKEAKELVEYLRSQNHKVKIVNERLAHLLEETEDSKKISN